MQIPEMNDSIYEALMDLWRQNSNRLPDDLRDPQVMHDMIFSSEEKLYVIPQRPTVIVVGSVRDGLSATVLLLNHEDAEVGEILREMRQIIEEFDLKRLTATVPGPVKEMHRCLERVGFRREGHLRRSTYYNGRLVGTDVFGMYRDPAFERRPNGVQSREENRGDRSPSSEGAAPEEIVSPPDRTGPEPSPAAA